MQGYHVHRAPDRGAWLTDGSWHAITALVPTQAARHIGGFDDSLPAFEDRDFFIRLQAAGVCGIRCPHLLLDYSDKGQRAKAGRQRADYHDLLRNIWTRNQAGDIAMGCCGTDTITDMPQDKQEGDILVRALYTPRQQRGMMSGRLYPRPLGFNQYMMWIDPRDAQQQPQLWQRVSQPQEITPDFDTLMALWPPVNGTVYEQSA
jgi:hypothetical protein